MSERPERLTPDEARALVDEYGSQCAAARALGVPRTTLQGWLDPEANRKNYRRYRAANLEKERQRSREDFYRLTGLAYQRRLLKMRRVQALHRMAERNRRRGGDLGGSLSNEG